MPDELIGAWRLLLERNSQRREYPLVFGGLSISARNNATLRPLEKKCVVGSRPRQ